MACCTDFYTKDMGLIGIMGSRRVFAHLVNENCQNQEYKSQNYRLKNAADLVLEWVMRMVKGRISKDDTEYEEN